MKQSTAVIQAVMGVGCVKSESGAYKPTEEQLTQIKGILFEGFKSGKIDLSPEKRALGDKYLISYIPGLINNHLRKAKELNGGVKYEIKNPGSRSENKVVKTLKALLATQEMSEDERAEIEAEITKIQAEEMKAKTPVIDVSLVPEHLRHLVK